MKRTNKAFTLLESLIVLTIVAMMLLISFTLRPNQNQINQWEPAFKNKWQRTRLTAQQTQKNIIVNFDKDGIVFDREKFKYPRTYQNTVPKQLTILKTGYVAPTTVTLKSGRKTIKLIFSLGGGDYRVEKSTIGFCFSRSINVVNTD